jgi:putative PEP-CTERM system TPR-repeat lipoprotein
MRIPALTLITLLLTLLLASCGSDPTPQEHIERAQSFLLQDDSASAVLELKNALQKDQANGQARWLLGKTYLDQGDVASAEKELERAMWLDWQPSEVTPAYAAALVGVGKFAEVVKLDDTGLTDDAKASLYTSQALAKVAMAENRDARKLIEKTLKLQPDSTGAKLAKAQLEINTGEIETAEATLEEVLESETDNANAWMALGEVQLRQQDVEAAVKSFEEVLKYDPDNAVALYQAALMSLQIEDYKKAEWQVNRLMQLGPKNPSANYLKGFLDVRNGRYEDAVKRLAIAEPLTKEFPQIAFFQGSAHLANGNLEMASEAAARFAALMPASMRGRKLLTTIRLEEGEFVEAEKLIRPVVQAAPNDTVSLQLLANALLQQGKTDEGITMLARVAQLEPDSARAQVSLGAGLLLNGKPEDASLHLETALELDPQYQQADLLLVLSLVEQGKYEEALAAAQELADREPDNPTRLNLTGWIHNRAGDTDKARAAYASVLARLPSDPGANHSLAQMAIAADDLEAAQGYYEAVLRGDNKHLSAMVQLALISGRRGDEAAMVTELERAIELHPRALQPRIMLARYHLSQGRADKVSSTFLGLNDLERADPRVMQLAAAAQVVGTDYSEALFTLEKLNETDPNSVTNLYLTALAAAGSNDQVLAEEKLQRAIELDPNYLPARLAMTKLLLQTGRIEAMQPQLDVLVREAPDNPEVLLLQAAQAHESDDKLTAIQFAQRAQAVRPTTQTTLALGSYYESADNSDGAQNVYRQWLKDNPDDSVIRMKLAFDNMDNISEAQTQYEEILTRNPRNVVALNNLAWIMRDSDPQQALEYARAAADVAPENAAVLDTLAIVELKNGNTEMAMRSIERALDKAPGQPSLMFHRAQIEQAAGQPDKALATLTTLLATKTEFPERDEARALLDSLQ